MPVPISSSMQAHRMLKLLMPNCGPEKNIFISRDVKDVLVSAFHHTKYRTEEFDGTISVYIRSDRYGASRICGATKLWQTSGISAEAFAEFTYETMHSDAEGVLVAILKFCGVPVNKTHVREAVEFSKFDTMKQLEKSNFFLTLVCSQLSLQGPKREKREKERLDNIQNIYRQMIFNMWTVL